MPKTYVALELWTTENLKINSETIKDKKLEPHKIIIRPPSKKLKEMIYTQKLPLIKETLQA